jgi:hypothetical protein
MNCRAIAPCLAENFGKVGADVTTPPAKGKRRASRRDRHWREGRAPSALMIHERNGPGFQWRGQIAATNAAN